MPAYLYVQPMGSRSKLRHDTSEMLVAATLDVGLTYIAAFQISVHLSFTGGIRLKQGCMS